MAVLALTAHRLRTFLTMLGIVIGIASVVAMVALGEGSRRKVLNNISDLGTNTLEIFSGKGFGDTRSAKIKTLVLADAEALARQDYAAGATPTVSTSSTLRYGAIEASAQVNGVSAEYFAVKGVKLKVGRFFDASAERDFSQEVVIDENAESTLFGGREDAIGKTILVGKVPCMVIGVTRKQQGFGSSGSLSAFLAFSGADSRRQFATQRRAAGQRQCRQRSRRTGGDATSEDASWRARLIRLQHQRYSQRDHLDDADGDGAHRRHRRDLAGRRRYVRMAVGARRSDIMQQFLTEAVLVCIVGGALGVLAALSAALVFHALGSTFSFVYSGSSIVAAFACSTLIGVVFGWLPARGAAQLDPVEALARE
jgi:macrolide transport system ATP-binding/permease protein